VSTPSPIERAARSIHALVCDCGASAAGSTPRAAFESIDPDELARVLDPMAYAEPDAFETSARIAREQAAAVIAWLTSSTPDTSSDPKETR
jgi:hypothetical protein